MSKRRAILLMFVVCLFFVGFLPVRAQNVPAQSHDASLSQNGIPQVPGATQGPPPLTLPEPALPPGVHPPSGIERVLARSRTAADSVTRSPNAQPFGASPMNSFSPIFGTTPSYASGGHDTLSVAVADVNRDGTPDLIVANSDLARGVSVLLGNGDGTFQSAVTYKTGFASYSVVVGDVNEDGYPDLVVGNSDGSVCVLMGNGDGTFQSPVVYYPSGYSNAYVVIVDVNGDGNPDIVVSSYCESNDSSCTNGVVNILQNSGNGTFQETQTYSSGGVWTLSVAVGDFNHDGRPDLAVVNYCGDTTCQTDGSVGILLGDGNGTFQQAVTYDTGGTPYAVALGDVNGDGKLDLVIANGSLSYNTNINDSFFPEGVVSVLLGNGNGSFQPFVLYDAGGNSTDSISIADVNGDGKLDVVVGNPCTNVCSLGTVGVLLGNGDGSFQPALSYGSGGSRTNFAVIADVNGDGNLDILVSNECELNDASCTIGSVGILLNNGHANFIPPSFSIAGFEPYAVAVGDLNGDGKADLAVIDSCASAVCFTNGGISVLLGNGDGSFQPPMNYDSGDDDASVIIADVNKDGIPDLVAASPSNQAAIVLLGNGDGTFQPGVFSYTGLNGGGALAVADVDGDGKLDLVIAFSSPNAGLLTVLLGNGDGTFQSPVSYNFGGNQTFSLAVGDVNGDGKPDLVVASECGSSDNCTTGVISVLLNNGDGTFQPAVNYSSGARASLSVAIGDLNGDGKPDVVVANSGALSVLLGNGDGTFQTALVSTTPNFSPPSGSLLALADYNGDGKLDVADGAGVLLLGNGDGTFQAPVSLGFSGAGIAAGDFNNDGKPDLVIAGTSSIALLQNIASNFLFATTTAMTSSVNPSPANQPVTFTATVTPGFNAGAPTGSITFSDGGNPLGMGTISGGAAAFTTSSLSPGMHSITAAYSGDSNYASSVSAAVSETINPSSSATTTSVLAAPNPSAYGQSVNLTATVTFTGSGTPTGNVTFTDGANSLGARPVSGGTATLTTAALGVDSHSITASYSGDSNFSASSSNALMLTVNQAASTIGISSSANPSSYNQSVMFTAAITPQDGGTATGTVTFKDGGTSIGAASVNGNSASFSLSTLAVGTHSIIAVYSGDGNVLGSSSSAISQVVNKQASTSAVTSSANPAIAGSSITFTITVSPQLLGTPTGTVTLKKNGGTLATLSLNSGQATYMTSSLGIGSFSIMAVYAGDSNFSSSTSPVLTQVVGKASTTTAVTSSLNPSNVGQSVTFTATVSSSTGTPPDGEVVAFKNGGTIIGSGGLSGGTATFTTSSLISGAHSITAVYSGDATFSASTSATLTQTVGKYSTTSTLTSSGNPSNVGQQVAFTATVSSSGGVPSDGEIVTFKNGGATLGTGSLSGGVATFSTSSLAAGSHSITAVYSGDATFLASTSATLTQMVDKYSTTSVVISNDASTDYGQLVTFTATVTSNSGPTPTGTVVFKNGAATLGTETLSGGTAMLSDTALAVGTRMITVVYNGDASNAGSTSPAISQVVAKAATNTMLVSSTNPSSSGKSVMFTATVTSSTSGTPTGIVVFRSGTKSLGTATLADGVASVTVPFSTSGSYNITATYNGSSDFTSSTSNVVTQVVN
jgi:Bacterial Ig-like domain (group 3)/FG-GAP-like repeat/FG-GAP repeat